MKAFLCHGSDIELFSVHDERLKFEFLIKNAGVSGKGLGGVGSVFSEIVLFVDVESVLVVLRLSEKILGLGKVDERKELNIFGFPSALFRRGVCIACILNNGASEVDFSERGTCLATTIQKNKVVLPAEFSDFSDEGLISLNEAFMVVFLEKIVDEGLVVDFLIIDDRNYITA